MPKLTFIVNGETKIVDATDGMSVMEIAVANDIPIDAICGGSLACATCHLIVEKGFEKTEAPSEDELDMLNFADNVSPHSRLSCQIEVNDAIDGIVLRLPTDQ